MLVREMIHDATQTLSDHHPTLTRFTLNPLAKREVRRTSYLKMDIGELVVRSTRERLELVWKE